MKKKLQVQFDEAAWTLIESTVNEANDGFEFGTITLTDVVNEMVLNSKVDIRSLQRKCTSFKKQLRVLAAKPDMDLDATIKALMELKSGQTKRKSVNVEEVSG